MSTSKVISDPLYGFVSINSPLLLEIIAHPWFQRLRYVKQLGVTDVVYPGAVHTRFQHALGSMHLMSRALALLAEKGIPISAGEREASLMAILLHDLGHGPYSHALEEEILHEAGHESVSYLLIQELNKQFAGELELATRIFRNSYERPFFHQLISSQLDIDRLDYLARDSFYTGVQEGKIGLDRILMQMNIVDEKLVIDEKGIYSIENFLTARRLMYWQVYLHKTAVSAERMLINVVRRARLLCSAGEKLPGSDALLTFLKKNYTIEDLSNTPSLIEAYGRLDDTDIWGAIKLWRSSSDTILSLLADLLVTRKIFRILLSTAPIQKDMIEEIRQRITATFETLNSESPYLLSTGTVTNEAYAAGESILILKKNGTLEEIAEASDLPNVQALTKIVKKNYLCWPKAISL